jgi:HAD superfamily hydrolase (TIGR01450 family)
VSVLADRYDLVIFDLDGVIYLIDQPIPGAPEAVERLRSMGKATEYVTNNASRRPGEVAALLSSMGVPAAADEVMTSALASARLLAERYPAGSPVLVVGAPALVAEVADAGLAPVSRADDKPAAVVQGYGRDVGWADLAEACIAVRAGAQWIATNRDRTLPSPRGPLPGNGSLVAALATALGREPDLSVGKPEPALFEQAAGRHPGARALVVGDRLDTDIEGARRAGIDSMLVLTGVSRAADLLAAAVNRRPEYVATDLSGLFADPQALEVPPKDGGGGWRVTGGASLTGAGTALDALRVLCGVAWTGEESRFTAGGPEGGRVLRELGLA